MYVVYSAHTNEGNSIAAKWNNRKVAVREYNTNSVHSVIHSITFEIDGKHGISLSTRLPVRLACLLTAVRASPIRQQHGYQENCLAKYFFSVSSRLDTERSSKLNSDSIFQFWMGFFIRGSATMTPPSPPPTTQLVSLPSPHQQHHQQQRQHLQANRHNRMTPNNNICW